jgi:hypothetical protein
MKKFTYTNPTPQHVTIAGKDVFLETGKAYELPLENAYIAALIEQGYLVLVREPKHTKTKRT